MISICLKNGDILREKPFWFGTVNLLWALKKSKRRGYYGISL
jgi:hypothetical protein